MSRFPSLIGKVFGFSVLIVSIIILISEMSCKISCGYSLIIFNFPFFMLGQMFHIITYPFLLFVFPTTLLFYMWIAYNIGASLERMTHALPKKRKRKT